MQRVAGIDGYKGGWLAVCVDSGDFSTASLVWNDELAELVESQSIDLALVDIPIGFTGGPGARLTDNQARKFIGARASSVFPTPCRAALECTDYEPASRVNNVVLGKKITTQCYALFPKMKEADIAVLALGQNRIREGHPEVSFTAAAGNRPAPANKKSLKGQFHRLGLLSEIGFNFSKLATQLSPELAAKADDLIDAAILAWSATRAASNKHASFPEIPEVDAKGLEMTIWA